MEDIYRSQFRLPYSLYESLKESAGSNRRSINAELVARLEDSFGAHDSEAGREHGANQPRAKAAPEVEILVLGFMAQVEQEVRRQAEELAGKLAEEIARKE